jgi:Ornithine cyclodeaminase/mu-crystallin family
LWLRRSARPAPDAPVNTGKPAHRAKPNAPDQTTPSAPTKASSPSARQQRNKAGLGEADALTVTRDDVTELGRVLTGESEGRRSPEEATAFDSTGLALQDLAVALVALERADELDLPTIDL